jgi:biotin synthase-like enzyme
MRLCSGVIVGMGETDDDLVDVAHALAELAPTSLPVNFLIPIDGTPLGDHEPPAVARCLRALALFRFTNPRAEIRAAGGRERCLVRPSRWRSTRPIPFSCRAISPRRASVPTRRWP